MNLYGVLKHALGIVETPTPQPAMAQITIIQSEPVKRPSGNRSSRSQG